MQPEKRQNTECTLRRPYIVTAAAAERHAALSHGVHQSNCNNPRSFYYKLEDSDHAYVNKGRDVLVCTIERHVLACPKPSICLLPSNAQLRQRVSVIVSCALALASHFIFLACARSTTTRTSASHVLSCNCILASERQLEPNRSLLLPLQGPPSVTQQLNSK
jgi:hypothetical protein